LGRKSAATAEKGKTFTKGKGEGSHGQKKKKSTFKMIGEKVSKRQRVFSAPEKRKNASGTAGGGRGLPSEKKFFGRTRKTNQKQKKNKGFLLLPEKKRRILTHPQSLGQTKGRVSIPTPFPEERKVVIPSKKGEKGKRGGGKNSRPSQPGHRPV